MLIDHGGDRHNRPIVYSLTPKEKDRLLELHFQRATQRQREAEAGMAVLTALAKVIAQERR